MISFIKFLKITLPLATVTTATIATTLLVSSTKQDIEAKNKDSKLILNSFEKEVAEFKERKIIYSEKGTAKGDINLSKEDSDKLEKLIDEGAEVSENGSSKLDEIQPQKDQKEKGTSPIEMPSSEPLSQLKQTLENTSLETNGEEGVVLLPPNSDDSGGREGEKEPKEKTSEGDKEAGGGGSSDLSDGTIAKEEETEAKTDKDLTPSGAENEKTTMPSNEAQQEGADVQRIEENKEVAEAGREESLATDSEGTSDEQTTHSSRNSEDSSTGDAEETRINLEHLKELQNKLSSSENALSAILGTFSI